MKRNQIEILELNNWNETIIWGAQEQIFAGRRIRDLLKNQLRLNHLSHRKKKKECRKKWIEPQRPVGHYQMYQHTHKGSP